MLLKLYVIVLLALFSVTAQAACQFKCSTFFRTPSESFEKITQSTDFTVTENCKFQDCTETQKRSMQETQCQTAMTALKMSCNATPNRSFVQKDNCKLGTKAQSGLPRHTWYATFACNVTKQKCAIQGYLPDELKANGCWSIVIGLSVCVLIFFRK